MRSGRSVPENYHIKFHQALRLLATTHQVTLAFFPALQTLSAVGVRIFGTKTSRVLRGSRGDVLAATARMRDPREISMDFIIHEMQAVRVTGESPAEGTVWIRWRKRGQEATQHLWGFIYPRRSADGSLRKRGSPTLFEFPLHASVDLHFMVPDKSEDKSNATSRPSRPLRALAPRCNDLF
jgi:hypothetical protein